MGFKNGMKFLAFLFFSLTRSIKLIRFQVKWRALNGHNDTSVGRQFPIDSVSVGKATYGELLIYSYANGKNEHLQIGNYVSIANDVKFILGGGHHMQNFATFPLKSALNIAYFEDALSKGPIIIEDEVWIGYGAIILSGVTIGKGAIVAAGAVVTKNVAPYTIVAGNPALTIRERFSEKVVGELLKLKLTDFSEKDIKENIDLFYSDIENPVVLTKLKELRNRKVSSW